MTFDIFENSAFSLSSLTESLVHADHKPTLLGDLKVFQQKSIATTTIQVEEKDGALSLIEFSQRGAPIGDKGDAKRKMRNFNTYRIAKGATITASEIQNVRAFGTESELLTAQKLIADTNQGLVDDVDLTKEFHRLAAVQGKLLDSDGSVVEDYYTAFGVTANADITIDAGGTLSAMKIKFNTMIRDMMKQSKGAWVDGRTGVVALCGDEFFDSFVSSSAVASTYLNQLAANELRGDFAMPYDMVKIFGITFINYRGTDDGTTVSIATDEAAVFPVGGNGIFMEYNSCGESLEVANTMGKPMYAHLVRDVQRNFWIRPEVMAYGNTLCLRPKMLNTLKLA